MDIVYIFRHSATQDLELRFSLRSVHKYLPYIRKVWVFGDRPHFISPDQSLIEHVPHEYTAGISTFRLPLRNFFLLNFFASLIPELDHEYLSFCDDYLLIDYVSEEEIRKDRVLENLDEIKVRGRGLWKDALWRTYDLLKRFEYPTYNFETHVPTYLTKTRVLETYCRFRDFVTEDPFYGPLAYTSIQNHALKHAQADLEFLSQTRSKAGFYKPTDYETIQQECAGKKYLNCDDAGWNDDLVRYLAERFPSPSKYEVW